MMRLCAPAVSVRRRFCFLILFALPLFGCASGPPAKSFSEPLPANLPEEISGVPFHPQDVLQCGPAALATALGWSGVSVNPDELEPLLFLPGREGTLQAEIKAQARRLGRIPYEIPPDPAALVAELAAGHPVLVLQNNGLSWWPAWHYAVVVGMNGDTLRLRSGTIEDYDLPRNTFLRTWRRANYWGIVALPPGEPPASVPPRDVLRAITDFARVNDAATVFAALRTAVFRWPADVGLRFALANHLYASGDNVAAETEYRRILAVAPEAAMARNNLAWLLAERGEARAALDLLAANPAKTNGDWSDALAQTSAFARCRAAGGHPAECAAASAADD